jgi:hypothetical protein
MIKWICSRVKDKQVLKLTPTRGEAHCTWTNHRPMVEVVVHCREAIAMVLNGLQRRSAQGWSELYFAATGLVSSLL